LKEHRNLVVTARRNYWAESEAARESAPETQR
jgi:hypothetical protein